MKNLIETAAGRKSADLVLKNCQIVNVYSGEIESGDIAIVDGKIVGIGSYDGDFIFDPLKDICKVAVIERHHETGKIGLGFLGGYGIKSGAVAIFCRPYLRCAPPDCNTSIFSSLETP